MMTCVDVRARLVDTLRRDLIGPGPGDSDLQDERLKENPSRWYLAGYLAPAPDDAAEEADESEDEGDPLVGEDEGADPETGRVRQLVDQWLARYPASSRDNLISRFRSLNDDAHLSAFFELFIHKLVTTRGHRVANVEPKLSHTEKRPDFLIETVEGRRHIWSARWRRVDQRKRRPHRQG